MQNNCKYVFIYQSERVLNLALVSFLILHIINLIFKHLGGVEGILSRPSLESQLSIPHIMCVQIHSKYGFASWDTNFVML